jgi:cell division transport system permease protein
MMNWLFVAPAERRLLPGGKYRGPTPWVVAIMTFVMLVVTAAALALANAASAAASGSASRYVIQLQGEQEQVGRVQEALRRIPGVTAVQAVTEGDMRRTLRRWLGDAANSEDLPVPALVHFDYPHAGDLSSIKRRVGAIAPGATLSAHEAELRPLLRTMRALQWLAIGLVALMLAATSATVVLAARGALDTNRSTIDVMHGIGATDVQVARLFQRRIALDSALGAAGGAACAVLALAFLVGGSAALNGQFGGLPALRGRDLLLLVLLPVVLVGLATWVARTAVLRTLRQAT